MFVDDHPSAAERNGYLEPTFAELLVQPPSNRHINIPIASCAVGQKPVERSLANGVQFLEVHAAKSVQLDNLQLGYGIILSSFVHLT